MIIRKAEPRDIPEIRERHREQNERDGTCYPMTDIFDGNGKLLPNIPLALVIEDEGKVLQGIVFENVPEMQIYGVDPRATAHLEQTIDGAWYVLAMQGYKVVNCAVPKQVVTKIQKPLYRAGFQRAKGLINFFRELAR